MGAETKQDHQKLPAALWQDAWGRRAQLLALAFAVPEFEGLQGQSIPLREGSAVLLTGLGRPREPRNSV